MREDLSNIHQYQKDVYEFSLNNGKLYMEKISKQTVYNIIGGYSGLTKTDLHSHMNRILTEDRIRFIERIEFKGDAYANEDTSEILTVEKFKSLMQEFVSDIEAIVNRPVLEGKEWLRTSEASEYLSISQSQLHKLKAVGVISCSKLGGTNYYDREEIDDLLEANKFL